MQDYFRHATRVGELTRIFLTELEARHAKPEARIVGFFKRKRLKAGYKLAQGRIDAVSYTHLDVYKRQAGRAGNHPQG